MEDSFRVRVDRAFGSLTSSSSSSSSAPTATAPPPPPPSSSSLSSMWSLTDEEIDRNPWNRDKEDPEPESEPGFGFQADMIKDLDDIDDDGEDDEQQDEEGEEPRGKPKPDDYNDEEWEIKNSIGLDCTLDNEEEEDQFDKVAVGKEKPGDRLYMKDAADYGIDIDSGTTLPISFKDAARDPRANHLAANLRLKEDAEAAKKMDSLRVSDEDSSSVVNNQINSADDGNLKSILKRKDDLSDSKLLGNQSDSKSEKRVRFDPECKDGDEDEANVVKDKQLEEDSADEALVYPLPPDYPSGIPDYMRNPSKYTRYTFDPASDVDEESNRRAYIDFLNMLKKPNAMECETDDTPFDPSKPVTFIPKKKTGDTAAMVDDAVKESVARRKISVGIAVDDSDDAETSAMEVDEKEISSDVKQRSGRQYRVKPKLEG
ncbi:hypothetical protein Tsubulata_033898 [Turnera subulata]|uniref:U5 small nuclear ribonucleoprotein TSSC4 n=1 Tax=Turnera subulata TaxID=218843 RepID=A0A9Q0JFY5_9ROSI|nr:hypothetical protein Tsubulata_033898 [Turnera subulata]